MFLNLGFIVLISVLLVSHVTSLAVYLRYGEETCIRESVVKTEFIAGEYRVEPQGRRISAQVKDPAGNIVYFKPQTDEGSFAFTSLENGDYTVCFSNSVENNGLKTIVFKITTGADYRSSGIAKSKNLKPIEEQVRQLEETIAKIRTDNVWLGEKRNHLNETNKEIISNIMWQNIILMLLLLGLTIGQVYYLKNYFRKKRIVVE